MTTQVKHPFASGKVDGADATLVQPSAWNAAHNVYLNKTNKSGVTVNQYDWVVNDASNNDAFTVTTTASDTRPGWVVQDATIANNAAGNVLPAGLDTTVNVQGNVTRGNWLVTSTTAGRLKDSGVAGTSAAPVGAVGVATSTYSGGAAGTVTANMTHTSGGSLETGVWADVSGSKSAGTIYQNTSGRKRRVAFGVVHVGGLLQAIAYVGSASPPTIIVAQPVLNFGGVAGAGGVLSNFFEVPNNHYYQIQITTGAIQHWAEMDE